MMDSKKTIPFVASLGIFTACVWFYWSQGLFNVLGFPTNQVLYAMPIALVIWLVSCLTDRKTYGHWLDFLSCMFFGTTVFTGLFVIGSLVKK